MDRQESYLVSSLIGPLLIHIFIGILLFWSINAPRTGFKELPIVVSYMPLELLEQVQHRKTAQIVSPSRQSLPEPPPPTAFQSERDSSVEKEQIRRGISEDASQTESSETNIQRVYPKSIREPASQNRAQIIKENNSSIVNQKHLANINKLGLDDSTLLKDFSVTRPTREDELQAALSGGTVGSGEMGSLSATRPFSRPMGSGARIVGLRGSPDFLPTLPDGDITLLNAKANQFAVFVRRVAIQVFSHLRSSGWERLSSTDVRSINKETTVRAVLSPKGELLSVVIEGSSGNLRFDDVLEGAVRSGARDPNPPTAAALRDGNIHLIFKARSWVQFAADPRTGAPSERRWLLLGTGLD